MGRILAGVLFVTACVDARIDTGPSAPGAVDPSDPNGAAVPVAQYAPQVCGGLSWTTTNVTGPSDISVITNGDNAQVLEAPLAGGAIVGYTLSKATNTQKVAPQLTFDSGYTAVSASRVGGQLFATGVTQDSINVVVVADDLSRAVSIGKLQPGFIAKPAFQAAGGIPFIPVADDQGLRIEEFDRSLKVTTTRVALSEPATGMTATQADSATVAAWSTASSCYMMTLYSDAPGPLYAVPRACSSPQLAIDPTTQSGAVVYQDADGIRMLPTQHLDLADKPHLLAAGGTAPRALWDGERIWVSHLDVHGDIVVGYLENGTFTSTTITANRPIRGSYELVKLDGAVWAISFDSQTYEANRLCIMPVTPPANG